MDETCDICGDIGVVELINTCSQCKINCEHTYCRQPFCKDVPVVWLCQPCGIGGMSSPRSLKEDLPRTLTPNSSDVVDHESTCSAGPSKLAHDDEIVKAGKVEQTLVQEDDSESLLSEACEMGSSISLQSPSMLVPDPSVMVQKENTNTSSRGKLLKWEKISKPGKVKYIPAQEAMKLSSGAKISGTLSKSSMNSKSGSSRISVPTSERTPIQPKAMSPKSSSHAKANPNCKLLGFPPIRHGSCLTNQVGQQEVTQTPKEPKGKKAAQAPRKDHFPMEQPADAITSAINTQHVSAKEDKVVSKASSASPQAVLLPPIVSSSKTCEINLTDLHHDTRHTGDKSDCSNVEPRKFNAENGDQMDILPKNDNCVRGPARDSSWKGSFKIFDTIDWKALNEGFSAHPPLKVRGKVYEFSKAMPQVLLFTMIPRSCVWTEIFLDDCPGDDDIGLYFFSSNSQRSAPYICLLEIIEKQDLVMSSHMDGVELLVFTSKLLQANSQRWNGDYYFWGIFRSIKMREAVCKHLELVTFPSQSSAHAQDDDVHRGDNEVEMEIDMLAGKDVGRLDIVIPRYRDERATAISLYPEIPCVSRNFSFATQKPLLEVKNEPSIGIPPGFEEIHLLNVHSRALTKMGGDGKTLTLDGEARNHEEESGRFKSLSEILRASRL